MVKLAISNEKITFAVRVLPLSSKTELGGEFEVALKIKIRSPPVEGAAKDELIRFLSKRLEIPQAHIEIVAGAASRTKRIRITATDLSRISAILQAKI